MEPINHLIQNCHEENEYPRFIFHLQHIPQIANSLIPFAGSWTFPGANGHLFEFVWFQRSRENFLRVGGGGRKYGESEKSSDSNVWWKNFIRIKTAGSLGIFTAFYLLLDYFMLKSPVGWGCRIHPLHFCKGLRPSPPPVYECPDISHYFMVRL